MSQSQLIKPAKEQTGTQEPKTLWNKPTITNLEADLAYFNARLEFIGIPTTTNQIVQQSVFKSLAKTTANIINCMR